jgi:diacylglycerol kinase (ATP)
MKTAPAQRTGARATSRYQSGAPALQSLDYAPNVAHDPLLVITNAEAGTADQATSVEVAATSNPGELDGVLHRAGSQRIVVAGGDGSMHAVVAALHRRNELSGATLALLPLGTGNDFARGTDIPLDIEEAARLVIEGEPRPVDLIVDETGEVVVNNVHVGTGAMASRKGSRWKTRLGAVGFGKVNLGRLGYPIGAVLAIFNPPHRRLRVEIDGEVVNDVDRPVSVVAVGNGANVGGGTEITPEADPEDGRLDVMISFATSVGAKVASMARLQRGDHLERDDVHYHRGSSVTVSGEEFYVSADGELYGPERSRTWRLERDAYTMVLPRR